MQISIEKCDAICGAQMRTLRALMHQNPELSLTEYETTRLLREMFSHPPFEIIDLTATGLVVRIPAGSPGSEKVGSVEADHPQMLQEDFSKKRKSGRVVAIRADIDALPVEEDPSHEPCSLKPGIMHACGHDMHTAYAAGAGLVLAQMKDELTADVYLIFQPAEENITGARNMLDAGLLEKIPIDCMIGSHVKPELPMGSVSIRHGSVMAAKDSFRILIWGQGGHGANPHACIDPIPAAAAVISALQTITSRKNDAHDPGVLSICSIHGGKADNIIPDEVVMEGSMRTTSPTQRAMYKQQIKCITEAAAAAYGCKGIAEDQPGVPVLVNDDRITDQCRKSAAELLGSEQVKELPVETISEDFACYAERLPSCFIGIGTAKEGEAYYPLHSSHYFPANEVLPIGAALLARCAIDLSSQTL